MERKTPPIVPLLFTFLSFVFFLPFTQLLLSFYALHVSSIHLTVTLFFFFIPHKSNTHENSIIFVIFLFPSSLFSSLLYSILYFSSHLISNISRTNSQEIWLRKFGEWIFLFIWLVTSFLLELVKDQRMEKGKEKANINSRSCSRQASSFVSDIWSQILSRRPSFTDLEVNKKASIL